MSEIKKEDIANFDVMKIVFNVLLDGEANIENCENKLSIEFPDKSKGAIEKDIQRAFKTIEWMYSLDIDSNDIILKKRGSVSFNSNGYKLFINNKRKIAQRDLILRYEYITAKDEMIKNHLAELIIENIADSLTAIDSFKKIEKEPIVKKINESILQNKQLKICTEKYEHIVNPLKIYYDNGFWYLAALKEDEKTWWINLNSIRDIAVLDSDNIYTKNTLDKYKKLQFDAFGDENREREYRIVLELVDEKQFSYFKNKRFKVTQRLAPEVGKFCVEFKFNHIWEIQPLILGWLNVISIKEVEYIKKDVTYDEKLKKEQEFYKTIFDNMTGFMNKNLSENIKG